MTSAKREQRESHIRSIMPCYAAENQIDRQQPTGIRSQPFVGCQPADLDYIAPAATRGGMAEWLKALAWKACIRETVSWVRIPLPPPATEPSPFSAAGDSASFRLVPPTFRRGPPDPADGGPPHSVLRPARFLRTSVLFRFGTKPQKSQLTGAYEKSSSRLHSHCERNALNWDRATLGDVRNQALSQRNYISVSLLCTAASSSAISETPGQAALTLAR
jgi:hypothetical protein